MSFSSTEVRGDFPVLRDGKLIYLDSAATAQRPDVVIRAESEFYSSLGANAHRGVYGIAVETTRLYESAREQIAGFIGADTDELVFTRNTTEGINLVARAWAADRLGPGKAIVTTVMEHHSNLVPWQMLAERTGCELRFVRLTSQGLLDMDHLKEIVDDDVAIVAVAHVSNVLGTVNPITDIAAIAHEHGAVCMVDGAQGAPHRSINVHATGCDFYAISGHKMMGPMGIGGLYINRQRFNEMQPFLGGGEMIDRVELTTSTFAKPPMMFEAGTQNVGGTIGWAAAVRYLQRLGMQDVEAHERLIGGYARQRLARINGITILGPDPDTGGTGGVLSFDIKGHHPHDVAQFLDRYGLAVRAGDHCAQPLHKELGLIASTRASFYIYNDMSDVDILASALKDLVLDKKSVMIEDSGDEDALELLDYYFKNPVARAEISKWEIEKFGLNSLCGDELQLRIHLDDHKVKDIQVIANGCKVSQASASLMAGAIRGKSVDEAMKITKDVQAMLTRKGPALTGELNALNPVANMPARTKCAILAWKTIEEALKDV